MTKLHHVFASIVICNIIKIGLLSVDAAYWNYDDSSLHGPSNWSVSYPMCGSDNQSPIDINNSTTTQAMPSGTTGLIFSDGYKIAPTNKDAYTLVNTGHGAQVNIVKNTASGMRIYGGGLEGTYILGQFHFHWGNTSQVGSEHLVNNTSYGLEIHFVHFAERFDDVNAAVASNETDALAVLGVFVNVATSESAPVSESLEKLAGSLKQIQEKGNEAAIDVFALRDLLPDECSQQFYRYNGSLTTPDCNEVVVWTVLKNAIYISDENMTLFRTSIKDADGAMMTHNYRPPQSIGGRIVYHFNDVPASCKTIQTTVSPPKATSDGGDTNAAKLHLQHHSAVLLISAIVTALHLRRI